MKTEKEILEAIGYAETRRDYSTGILREQLNERIRDMRSYVKCTNPEPEEEG